MQLDDIIGRVLPPAPWSEGDKIPWNEPGFSRRMLQEHLSQTHDAASRRTERIELHVAWIHDKLMHGHSGRILDLGCGPGLYASRLAALGHTCVGIDFSPASVAYARELARADNLSVTYHEHDIRTAEYGSGYDLAMFIFGELNVFRPEDARKILTKAHDALRVGGRLLLEVSFAQDVQNIGRNAAAWYSSPSGLFSDHAHICLKENFWNESLRVATERFYIVDSGSGGVTRFAASTQAYTQDEYRDLVTSAQFHNIQFPMTGPDHAWRGDFLIITAEK